MMIWFLVGFLTGFILFPIGYTFLRYYSPNKYWAKNERDKSWYRRSKVGILDEYSSYNSNKKKKVLSAGYHYPIAEIKHGESLGSSGAEISVPKPTILNAFIDDIYRVIFPSGSLEKYRKLIGSHVNEFIEKEKYSKMENVSIGKFEIKTLKVNGLSPSLSNISFKMSSRSAMKIKTNIVIGPGNGSSDGSLTIEAQAICSIQLLNTKVSIPCGIYFVIKRAKVPVTFEIKKKEYCEKNKNSKRTPGTGGDEATPIEHQEEYNSFKNLLPSIKMAFTGLVETDVRTNVVFNDNEVIEEEKVTNIVNNLIKMGTKKLIGTTIDLRKRKVITSSLERSKRKQ